MDGLEGDKKILQDELKKLKKAESILLARLNVSITGSHSVDTIWYQDNDTLPTYTTQIDQTCFKGQISSGPTATVLDLTVSTDLVFSETWERTGGVFSDKQLYIMAKSNCPQVNFTGLEQYKVEGKAKRFSIGCTVGPGINLFTGDTGIMLSAGLNYRIK